MKKPDCELEKANLSDYVMSEINIWNDSWRGKKDQVGVAK